MTDDTPNGLRNNEQNGTLEREGEELPPEAGRIAVGLWQAAEAFGMLAEQAERLGLPAPTVVAERLTFEVFRGLADATKRYAELLAERVGDAGHAGGAVPAEPSGLVIASPGEARSLVAAMRRTSQELSCG